MCEDSTTIFVSDGLSFRTRSPETDEQEPKGRLTNANTGRSLSDREIIWCIDNYVALGQGDHNGHLNPHAHARIGLPSPGHAPGLHWKILGQRKKSQVLEKYLFPYQQVAKRPIRGENAGL